MIVVAINNISTIRKNLKKLGIKAKKGNELDTILKLRKKDKFLLSYNKGKKAVVCDYIVIDINKLKKIRKKQGAKK